MKAKIPKKQTVSAWSINNKFYSLFNSGSSTYKPSRKDWMVFNSTSTGFTTASIPAVVR
jgi:hypothetical protein